MEFANKRKTCTEYIVENAITNLETGEKMEARFFKDSLIPHNIPESWKRVKVSIKDSASIRVV